MEGLRRHFESLALADCRAFSSAETTYAAANRGGYGRPECLRSPTGCGFRAGTTPFIEAEIVPFFENDRPRLRPKAGYYRLFVAGAIANGSPDPGLRTFVYAAWPFNPTLKRAFAVDHTGRICFTTDGTIPPIVDGALDPRCSMLK